MSNVLILGAGFGGLEVATRLAALGDLHITLIDKNDAFVFGFSKLDVMFGRKSADEIRNSYRPIDGVDFRRETITSIDPTTKRVTTDASAYDADVLVVALGADYDPAATPGLVENGCEFYSVAGADRAASILNDFDQGRIVVGVLGMPFKCPPAPYETVLLLHDYLTGRGVRDSCDVALITPMPSPIPVSKDVSSALVGALDERGIAHTHEELVTRVDPNEAQLRSGGTVSFDLFLGIPVHRAPEVARPLCEQDGWIGVDQNTLRTKWDGVFALGDVASAPVPRAGVFAEDAAATVAAEIAGSSLPYRGKGNCYIEFGGGLVAKVDANFLEGPQPVAELVGPSQDIAREKAGFATERKKRWFGA
jgi:sulfide:quinone oxidoreductase